MFLRFATTIRHRCNGPSWLVSVAQRSLVENPYEAASKRVHEEASSMDSPNYSSPPPPEEGGTDSFSFKANSQHHEESHKEKTYRRYESYDDGGGIGSNTTHHVKQNRSIHEKWRTLLKPHNLTQEAKEKFRMVTKIEEDEQETSARKLRMQEYQRVLDFRRNKGLPPGAATDRERVAGDSSDVRVSIRPRSSEQEKGHSLNTEPFGQCNRESSFWLGKARERDEQHTRDLEAERKIYEAAAAKEKLRNDRDAQFAAKGETAEKRRERMEKERTLEGREEAKDQAINLLVKAERRVRFSMDYGSLFFMQHLSQAELMIEEAEEMLQRFDLMTPQLAEDIEQLRTDRYEVIFKLDLEGQHVDQD